MDNRIIKSKDLHLAAYLIAAGQKLQDTFRDGRTCFFIFEDSEELSDLSRLYWNGEGQVGGRAFTDALARLKDIVFYRD